jgi:hypothetical protein
VAAGLRIKAEHHRGGKGRVLFDEADNKEFCDRMHFRFGASQFLLGYTNPLPLTHNIRDPDFLRYETVPNTAHYLMMTNSKMQTVSKNY